MTEYSFDLAKGVHALVEMVLVLEFQNPLFLNEDSVAAVRRSLEGELPNFEQPNALFIGISQDGQPLGEPPPPPAIFSLTKPDSDGEPEWIVRVDGHRLMVHCLDYSRWSISFNKAVSIIKEVLAHADGALALANASIKIVDAFKGVGDKEYFNSAILLDRDSGLLNASVFNSGYRWHQHTGWFEDASEGCETLVRLNLDCAERALSDGFKEIYVVISNSFTLRGLFAGDSVQPVGFALDDDGWSRMTTEFGHYHWRNKTILQSILQNKVIEKIHVFSGEE